MRGIIQLIPLLLTALILALILAAFVKNGSFPIKISTPVPTATATVTATPTTASKPTSVGTVKPSATATSKPTSQPVSGQPGSGYSRITVHTEKGDFAASVLSLSLTGARAITDTANDAYCPDNCPVLPLDNYVTRNGGFAGVNGTYFCPETYPECAGKKNAFDFPVYNTRLGKWINAGNLFWNGRSMVYFDGSGAHYKQNANSFSGGLTAGIVNYPGLVDGGNVQIDDNQSGLSDKQRAVGTKVGIGLRGSQNVMLVIGSNVNMQQFAYVFKALGADSALNLDTGGSTALWFGGYKAGPGRNIPNAIIFASR